MFSFSNTKILLFFGVLTKKNIFFIKYLRESKKLYLCSGEMAEWSIAAVLKTVVQQCTGGSNPSFSAEISDCKGRFYSF